MKFLISLLLITLAPKECNNKNTAQAQQNDITITYEASSRGYFEEISVTQETFTLCKDLSREQLDTFKNKSNDWKECLILLKAIDTESLPNLKAPTGMRLYDGAPHATLIIKTSEKEIRSSSFDHGHPPTEIKALVEKLLSFKKIASKE